MTRKGAALNQLYPEALAEINTEDAALLNLKDGDRVSLISRRGDIQLRVSVSNKTGRGVVFVPFHFYEAAVNRLTNSALDPVSKIPEFKACAVRMEKK